MSFVIIVVFVVLAGVFIASRSSTVVRDKLASAWAAIIALLVAAGTYAVSWWANVPVDVPPM